MLVGKGGVVVCRGLESLVDRAGHLVAQAGGTGALSAGQGHVGAVVADVPQGVVIASDGAQGQSLDGFPGQFQVAFEAVPVFAVERVAFIGPCHRRALQFRTQSQFTVLQVGGGQTGEADSSRDDAAKAAGIQATGRGRLVAVGGHAADPCVEVEVLGQVHPEIDAGVVAVVVVVFQQTVMVQVAHGHHVLHLLASAADAQLVLGLQGMAAQQFVQVHLVGIVVGVGTVAVLLDHLRRVGLGAHGHVVVFGIFIGVCQVGQFRGLAHAYRTVVGDACLAFLTLLGGDQDDAVGSARTVDGSGRGVLQHGDVVNVCRGQVAQRAGHTVHQHQGAGRSAERAHTADADGAGFLSGITAALCDGDAGHQTGEHVGHIGHGARLHGLAVDGGDGADDVHLLLDAVAHYDYFVQHFGVFLQRNVVLGSAGFHRQGLGGVAHIADLQLASGGNRQLEVAVHVGDDTVGGACLSDAGTDDG